MNKTLVILTTAFLWYGNSSESAGFKQRFGDIARTTELVHKTYQSTEIEEGIRIG